MKHIPNILSLTRLLLCPVFIWTFFACRAEIALCVFVFASLLDVFDGFLARKLDAVSNLGKILDPLADKLLQLSGIICLTVKGCLPWPVPALLCAKELTMLIGGTIFSRKQKEMVFSNAFGKAASLIMSVSISLMFFAVEADGVLHGARLYLQILVYIALALSITALVQYGIIYIRKGKK